MKHLIPLRPCTRVADVVTGFLAIANAMLLLTGCPRTPLPSHTIPAGPVPTVTLPPDAAGGAPRRATAAELLEAAQSGQVPDWFSDAERSAVRRLQ